MVQLFGHLAFIDFVMSQFDPGDFRCADSGPVTSKIEAFTKTYQLRKATRIFFVHSDQRVSFELVARTFKIHPTSHQHLKIMCACGVDQTSSCHKRKLDILQLLDVSADIGHDIEEKETPSTA